MLTFFYYFYFFYEGINLQLDNTYSINEETYDDGFSFPKTWNNNSKDYQLGKNPTSKEKKKL